MDNNVQSKLVLASIAKLTADRDETVFKINAVLNSEYKDSVDYVGSLTTLFKELSQQELTIEAIQVYYARHFKKPENDTTP